MNHVVNRREFAGCRPVVALAAFAVGAVLLAPVAWADEGARAARLSSVDGQVTLSQGNEVLADSALANTPLFEGTQVATGEDGRAEIQFEDGSVARLSPSSSLTLTVLRGQGSAGNAEIRLEAGLGYFELQGGGEAGTIRVRFGDSTVTASGFTVLRINIDNPPGEVAVFSGNAHLERGSALALDLHGGESVTFSGVSPGQYDLAESIEPDSWDTWNADRDQVLTSAAAATTQATSSFANNSNPAWSDLDANGNWYNVPGQGYIWSPYEAGNPGWEPYGNGYWMWTPRFGYIWVSGYGWGYMPYQCGMWNYYDAFGWGWEPGMGYCSPWWGRGYYGTNIGSGYRGPTVPKPPRGRRPTGGKPITAGGKLGPYPVIAVNRRQSGGPASLPARDRTTVATIAGHAVLPLHPLSPRPQYDGSEPGFASRTGGYGGARTPGSTARATGPGYSGNRQGSSYASRSTGSSGGQHASSSSHSYSSGGSSGGHASSGGGAASSGGGSHGGGGGGGGSAVSGGGGGSSGGGSHK
jgi:hypothetical protein